MRSRCLHLESLEDRSVPATHTWIGPATGGLWSNATNWNGGAPTTNETGGTIVQFNGNVDSTDNIANLFINELHFTAGGDTVRGSSGISLLIQNTTAAITNQVVNDTGTNTIESTLPLFINNGSVSILVTAGQINVASSIIGDAGLRLVAGSDGVLRYSGATANTYGGPTDVDDGRLELAKTAGVVAVPGVLGIGDGINAAILRLFASNQIADGAFADLASGGLLDLNGFSETIGRLDLDTGTSSGSQVTTGAGTLTLTDDVRVQISGTGAVGATITGKLNLGAANRSITVDNGNADVDLDINALISNSVSTAGQFIKDGFGTMRLSGSTSNTYSQTTQVNNGTLELFKSGASVVAIPAALVIGDGIGPPNSDFVRELANNEIADSSAITIVQSGILDFSSAGLSDTIGSLTITGGAVLTGTVRLNGDLTATSGAISSALILANLSLNGSTRTFTINDGPLADDLLVTGVISGTGSEGLTKQGTGTLALANANTYSGTTTVAAGVLSARDSQALGGGGCTVLVGATLALETDSTIDSVTGTFNKLSFSNPLTINGNSLPGGAVGLKSVSGINILSGAISLAGFVVAIGVEPDPNPNSDNSYFTNDFSLTITGPISGGVSTALDKVRTGHLILTGANTYSGQTTIHEGWVTVQNNSALGDAVGDTRVFAGAALHLKPLTAGGSLSLPETIQLTSNGINHPFSQINGQGALENLGGRNTVSGNVVLNSIADIGVTLLAPSTDSLLTLSGTIRDGTAPASLVKLGTGTLELSTTGQNTYTGLTRIVDGSLLLNTDTPDAGVSPTVIVGDAIGDAGSAVLQLGPHSNEIPNLGSIIINSDGQVNIPSGTTEDITTLTMHGGDLDIDGTFRILTGGDLSADGNGASIIDGSGNLDLQSGTVRFDVINGSAPSDLLIAARITQSAPVTLIKSGGGTLEFNTFGSGNTYTGATDVIDGVLRLNSSAINAGVSSSIVVGDDTGAPGSAILQIRRSDQIPDAGSITVKSDGLVDVGNSTSVIEEVDRLSLGTSAGGGTMTIGLASVFRTRSIDTSPAPTSSTISGPGTLQATTFIVGNGNANPDLLVSTIISGAGTELIKTGQGLLRLTADNIYTGATKVSAGTLEVDGNQPSSPVTVFGGGGGILGGSGTVGPITVSGGTLTPGLLNATAPSTLHFGNVNLNGGTFAPVISGTPGGAADQVSVTGTVNLGGSTLSPLRVGSAVPPGQSFVIISNDGSESVSGNFVGLPDGAVLPVGGQTFRITYSGGDGNDIVLTPAIGTRALAVAGSRDGTARLFAPNSAGQFGGNALANLHPFGSLSTDLRTAMGDINGDGIEDAVLATGPGTPIRVAVISGADNSTVLVAPFDPFGGNFTGGGFVAAADIDGDGRAEFIVTPDQGGGPRVSIFAIVNSAAAVKANFLGIDDSHFRGGCRAALGDVNKDGKPDLAVSAGFLGGPRTALFNGSTLFTTPTKLVGDFFAFPGSDATTLRNGVFVAAGDVNGDGFSDLIFGGGPGGAPRVFVLSGALISANNIAGAQANPIANFFVAGNASDRGGVRLAAKDADGDAKAEVVAGSGEGSPARVRVYLGKNFTGAGEPGTFQDLNVLGGGVLTGGVFVG